MGFESSEVARRRLAVLAASNPAVQEALAPATYPGTSGGAAPSPAPARVVRNRRTAAASAEPSAATVAASLSSATPALARQLDDLAQDIVAIPGAGGALLAAYAAQARALSMVVEAARRAGAAPLPTAVLLAVQEALATPTPLPGLAVG